MITDKEIEQSRSIIKQLIEEGSIREANQEFVDFFLKKAENSLNTAYALLKISTSSEIKESMGLPDSYDAYLWMINTAYYTMFYAATALLAKFSHRIKKEQGIHALTYHALVYYFLDNDKKLTKHVLEQYQAAEQEASELLQVVEQKARDKIEMVKYELSKRREFTYEMGKIAERNKAETSIRRAEDFITLVKEIIL